MELKFYHNYSPLSWLRAKIHSRSAPLMDCLPPHAFSQSAQQMRRSDEQLHFTTHSQFLLMGGIFDIYISALHINTGHLTSVIPFSGAVNI